MPDHFRTDRLHARPLTLDDLDLIVELNSDAEVMRYITGKPLSVEDSAAELADSLGARWLLFRSDDETFVGWVGAVPTASKGEFDIGWRLRRDAWGKGFATEAARALVDLLFAEGAHRVAAETMAVNLPSRAVMERIGLSYVRTFHVHFADPLPGTELGEVEYAQTRPHLE